MNENQEKSLFCFFFFLRKSDFTIVSVCHSFWHSSFVFARKMLLLYKHNIYLRQKGNDTGFHGIKNIT